MMIDGKQIERFQKKKAVSNYYYNVIKTEVRHAISELPFLKIVGFYISKSTESLYFEVRMNRIDEIFILSFRTHHPLEIKANYLYFYLDRYSTLKSLRADIQMTLIAQYKHSLQKQGLEVKEIKKRKPFIHQTAVKKKSKNKKCQKNDFSYENSFNQFMQEVNGVTTQSIYT